MAVLEEQGCLGCHSLDGSDSIGPSLQNLAGASREINRDGETLKITVDEEYLTRAIRQPDAELVAGYEAMMPPYDEETVSKDDLQAVIDLLLGKAEAAAPALDGAQLIEENGCTGCHSTDGSDSIAPTFKGLGQRQTTIERDGQELTIPVDAEYLHRALLEPNADLVKGYAPMMPAADYLSEAEIEAMIQYLLTQ